jgi:hypothetical protein
MSSEARGDGALSGGWARAGGTAWREQLIGVVAHGQQRRHGGQRGQQCGELQRQGTLVIRQYCGARQAMEPHHVKRFLSDLLAC